MKKIISDDFNRRKFLSSVGKGFGMMALSSTVIASLFENLQAATRKFAHLSPEQVAADEDFWAVIQQSFSVTRGIINLNNGGVSPSPRIVTEAFVRYTWQQEDATAYTMWQMFRAAIGNYPHGFGRNFRLRRGRNCHYAQRFGVARNFVDGIGFQIRRRDFDNDARLRANVNNAQTTRITRRFEVEFNQNSDCAARRQRYCKRF